MKKRTAVILAVFLIVSLASCGRSSTSSTENETDSNEVEELQPEMEDKGEDQNGSKDVGRKNSDHHRSQLWHGTDNGGTFR